MIGYIGYLAGVRQTFFDRMVDYSHSRRCSPMLVVAYLEGSSGEYLSHSDCSFDTHNPRHYRLILVA